VQWNVAVRGAVVGGNDDRAFAPGLDLVSEGRAVLVSAGPPETPGQVEQESG